MNDNITENDEMFSVSLTLDPADQDRLGNRVTVSPGIATLTIQDNNGNIYLSIISVLIPTYSNTFSNSNNPLISTTVTIQNYDDTHLDLFVVTLAVCRVITNVSR